VVAQSPFRAKKTAQNTEVSVSMPFDRIVQVRAHKGDGRRVSVASGILVSDRHVLTARHALLVDGVPLDPIFLSPAEGGEPVRGQLAWPTSENDHDLALLEITAPEWAEPSSRPMRWGWLSGSAPRIPCEVIGFPVTARDEQLGWDTDHLSGHINPGAGLRRHQYEIHVDDSLPRHQGPESMRGGLSGAAVVVNGLLVGIITADNTRFSGRLIATPIDQVVTEPAFKNLVVGTGGHLPVDPAELVEVFYQPVEPARSPAGLLRAEVETVRFQGRSAELDGFERWCNAKDAFSSWLLHGQGGQGKTRLARELCHRRSGEWVAGFVSTDIGDRAIRALAETRPPLLLVVDYAETRTDQLRTLLRVLWMREHTGKTRLLLLARSPGEWWSKLGRDPRSPLGSVHLSALSDWTDTLEAWEEPYRLARRDLATGLARMQPNAAWLDIAARLSLPESDRQSSSSALGAQLRALTSLLQAGPSPVAVADDESPERVLLAHEERYWQATGRQHGLRLHDQTLRCAVVAATLCGSADGIEAIDTTKRVPLLRDQPQDVLVGVATWLHDLYPVQDGYWGFVQPDRLAECLVGSVLPAASGLAKGLLTDATDLQARRAFTLLGRAAAEQTHLTEQITAIMEADPVRFATLTVQVATEVSDPRPLMTALERCAEDLDFIQLAKVVEAFPTHSASLARLAASLTRRAEEKLRTVRANDPKALMTAVIGVSVNLAERLAAIGDHDDALASAEKAVAYSRSSSAINPDRFQPELAVAVGCLSSRLAIAGRHQEALEAAYEAYRIRRFLVSVRRDGRDFLPGLADSLNNLSVRLADVDRVEEGVEIAGQAVSAYRELAKSGSPDHRHHLAGALNNWALGLFETGHRSEALAACDEATEHFRRLAKTNRDLYEHGLAKSLGNLAFLHQRSDEGLAALTAAEEAVGRLRGLANRDPVAFRPDLAHALNAMSKILSKLPHLGRREEALRLIHEAVTLRREIAKLQASYRPDLAKSLTNLAEQLVEVGQGSALNVVDEAITNYRVMHPITSVLTLGELARSLRIRSRCLAAVGQVERGKDDAFEAVKILRKVVKSYGEGSEGLGSLPDLVLALDELISRLDELSLNGEALEARTERAARVSDLYRKDPDGYRSALLPVLLDLMARFYEADLIAEAVALISATADVAMSFPPDEIAANSRMIQRASAVITAVTNRHYNG
jgi:tetratricopeptide (TPR) repeat protein